MTRIDYRIVGEPRGESLEAILAQSLDVCDGFLFALTDMHRSGHAEQLIADMEPFLISRIETNEYPAATLPWGTVTVCRYRLTATSVRTLGEATSRLYDWQEPDLPNDLCLMRGDEAWLITMASDRVAILALEEAERSALCAAVSKLKLVPMQTDSAPDRRQQDDAQS